jgi:Ca2+-dependent lipid-binding protein
MQSLPLMGSTSAMSSVRICISRQRSDYIAHACAAGFPDPFAVATINGEQTRTTSVIKKTLNPYWNESFDMYVIHRDRLICPRMTLIYGVGG